MQDKQNNSVLSSSETVPKAKLQEVTEIFKLLAKTFSQMKIFSPEHENVLNFKDQLYNRLKAFLDKYWKLEIEASKHTLPT